MKGSGFNDKPATEIDNTPMAKATAMVTSTIPASTHHQVPFKLLLGF
jgi:hypothetical protein